MKKIFLLSLAFIMSFSVFAQETFKEGKLTMNQTITTNNEEMKGMIDQMFGGEPMQIVMYIKGNKSRSEVSNAMSGDVVSISDSESMQTLMLMDNPMIGKKYSKTALSEADEKELEENVTITEGEGTKTILGYECKEQIIKVVQEGVEMEMTMYVTDKILPVMTQQTSMLGNKLNGFPMYMVMNMNQQGMDMIMTFEVVEMNKESVPDSKFDMTPPEGYSELQGY